MSPTSCVLHSSVAEKPLASSSRKCDKEQGFCKRPLRTLFEVPPPAVVLPDAQACEWINRHPLPQVPWGFYFNQTLRFAFPY